MKITSAQMNTPSWCLNTEKYEAVQIPPTPWYVGEMNDNGIRVAPVADPRNAVAYAFDEDTAAFIVRACNSHDALTAAGKRLADVAEACARGDDEAVPESLRNLTQQDVADAINAMRVALTAAGVAGVSAPDARGLADAQIRQQTGKMPRITGESEAKAPETADQPEQPADERLPEHWLPRGGEWFADGVKEYAEEYAREALKLARAALRAAAPSQANGEGEK